MPNFFNPALLVGYDTNDDACVYEINEHTALVQTVDFFTPIVDDPYQFGQIAAANSLSDVYAMGGEPKLAMNLLCVPKCLPLEIVQQILKGGHDKAVEAGCTIAGGHTIEDNEPKYGMCVSGFAHPTEILRNRGAKVGDLLVLTKPLGSGIINTGAKADLVAEADLASAIQHMTTLNKAAAAAVRACGAATACTDITGFGLLGHALEMAAASQLTIRLNSSQIPCMDGALELAEMGIIPAGAYRNMEHVQPHLQVAEQVPQALLDILADPQTSGGLLVALPPEAAQQLLAELQATTPWAAVVGELVEQTATSLEVY